MMNDTREAPPTIPETASILRAIRLASVLPPDHPDRVAAVAAKDAAVAAIEAAS